MNNITSQLFAASLQCVRTRSGRYTLTMRSATGKLRRVKNIGFGTRPFEIVAQFDGTPFIAIKKYSATPYGIVPQLYLLNTITGQIDESTQNGVKTILFNPTLKQFFIDKTNQQKINTAPDFKILSSLPLAQTPNVPTAVTDLKTNTPAPQIVSATTNGTQINTVIRGPRKRNRKHKLQKRTRSAETITHTPKRNATKSALSAKITVPYSLKPQKKIKYNIPSPRAIAARRKFMQLHLQRQMMDQIQMQY